MADTPALNIPAGTTSGSILDQGAGVTSAPVSLDDLVHTAPINSATPPIGAVRNQAAKAALLSGDPTNATQNYQLMMNEANQGGSDTLKSMSAQITQDLQKQDYSSVMNSLANPNLTFEQKQGVIAGFNKNAALKDTGMALHTNLLQAPSKGESPDGENARISVADTFNEMYKAQSEVQGMVNSLKKEDDEVSPFGQFLNHVRDIIPGVSGIANDKVYTDFKGNPGYVNKDMWRHITNIFEPGNSIAEMRDTFASLPPQEQVAFAGELMKSVKARSGLIFGTDNQHTAYEQMANVVSTGSYGNASQFIDNTFGLLDVLGVGGIAKDVGKVASAAKNAIRGGAEDVAAARAEPFVGPGGPGAGPAEPSFGQPSAGTKATPGRGPAADVSDVPFTESTNGNFKVVQDTAPPSSQLANPQPKLTAPVDQVAPATKVAPMLPDNRADTMTRLKVNGTVAERNPASPGEIAAQSNPEAARAMHEAVFTDPSDATSEAIYGASKQDALASNIMPQAETESGAVATRVADMDKNLRQKFIPDSQMINIIHDAGGEELTKGELAAARANVVNDFGNAEGMVQNTGMSSFKSDGRYTTVSAVYETPGGSWSDAEKAVEQAKYALRGQGVLDSDITILAKKGLDHVPVSLDEVRGKEGDYKIQINMNRPVSYNDLEDRGMDAMQVRLNYLDRFSALTSNGRGSFANHIMEAASMLDRTFTGAGAVADRQASRLGKRMFQIATEFSDRYAALVPARGESAIARKARIDDYIREANYKEIPFDVNDLQARGFVHNEIQTLTKFREYWDNHYYLENMDLVGSMDRQGYQMFKNSTTELHARPIAKNRQLGSMYDPSTDTVRAFTDAEIDHIYNTGGTIAKFRSEIDFAGQKAEHMVSRNTPTEYLRKLRDSDKLLNYRDGYFQLQYKSPKFVDRVERGESGAVTKRTTVAVAGDSKEAQAFADRMNLNNPGKGTHEIRNDDRALTRDRQESWDIDQAAGRISQRHRGKLLEDASGLNRLGDGSYIVNPSESIMKSMRSISGRVISRPMIDTGKARFMQDYGKFLNSEKGQLHYPATLEAIGEKGNFTGSQLADARTTWMYLNSLENGYINSMDQVVKAMLFQVADAEGGLAVKLAAKGGKVANHAAGIAASLERGTKDMAANHLSHNIKGSAFLAYIAPNIPRQLIIQPYQAIRTLGYNPVGWLNGKVPANFMGFVQYKFGLGVNPRAKDFIDFVEKTGILETVDHHSLIRGTLLQAADAGKTGIVNKAIGVATKYGFTLGESANQIGHTAAVYERFKRLGYDMKSKETVSAVIKEVDALTLGLTKSNEAAYNSGSMAAALQFLQIPQKMWLSYFNRQFDFMTSARMFATDMILWGAPTGFIANMLGKDVLPDGIDPTTREYIQHGVLVGLYNHALNAMFEGYKGIDFSSLDPFNLDGWQKLATALMGGAGNQGLFASTPAGTLVTGRIADAVKSVSRYFTGLDKWDDNDPVKFTTVLSDVMKITSLWNNASKAILMLDMQKRLDKYGQLIDDKTTTAEAIAQGFGFGSLSQKQIYDMSTQLAKDSKTHKDNALSEYQDIKKYYAQKFSEGNVDPHYITSVTGAIINKYRGDPVAMDIIQKQMQFDMTGPDKALLMSIVKAAGLPNRGALLDKIHSLPPAMQQYVLQLEQVVRDTDNAKQYLKDKEEK